MDVMRYTIPTLIYMYIWRANLTSKIILIVWDYTTKGATIWLPGGGGGVLVRLEYFFYMFSETEIFFQHHRGLEFFFLPMYDARSNFFYCTVRMNNYMY